MFQELITFAEGKGGGGGGGGGGCSVNKDTSEQKCWKNTSIFISKSRQSESTLRQSYIPYRIQVQANPLLDKVTFHIG